MTRMTSQRCNGIKSGYWSPAKKEDLVQRLGRYEDTGLEPAEIKKSAPAWISVKDQLPEDGASVLAYDPFLLCQYVAWYDNIIGWTDGEYTELKVTHWMPLPNVPEVSV